MSSPCRYLDFIPCFGRPRVIQIYVVPANYRVYLLQRIQDDPYTRISICYLTNEIITNLNGTQWVRFVSLLFVTVYWTTPYNISGAVQNSLICYFSQDLSIPEMKIQSTLS